MGQWIVTQMPRMLAGIVGSQHLNGDDAWAGNPCSVFVGVGNEADWVPWRCGQLGLVRINLGVLRNVTCPSLVVFWRSWHLTHSDDLSTTQTPVQVPSCNF